MIEGIGNTLTVILFGCSWIIDPFVEMIREVIINRFETKSSDLLQGCRITLLLILPADWNTDDLLAKMKRFSRCFKSATCNDPRAMYKALVEELFVNRKEGHIPV